MSSAYFWPITCCAPFETKWVWIGRAFFIWVSVFNLFVVSVFWSLMVDVFNGEQGKRLFGLLAAGATAGGLLGSGLISSLAGIAVFILLYTVTSTFLYFQQLRIAEANFSSREARTAFFARIDLIVNACALGLQLFATRRLLNALGLTFTLCILPAVSLIGFAALVAKPAREILFTAVSREDRYKAKNFIDTVVYRGGDQLASWGYAGLMGLGLALTQIPLVALPLSAQARWAVP